MVAETLLVLVFVGVILLLPVVIPVMTGGGGAGLPSQPSRSSPLHSACSFLWCSCKQCGKTSTRS